MKLPIEELQKYVDTCPIAYYAGRPIKMTVKRCQTSYADIVNEKIVISSTQLNQSLDKVDDVDISLVRPLVYHEVSHVILSPKSLSEVNWTIRYSSNEIRDIFDECYKLKVDIDIQTLVNIVEDERIETVYKNVYMDVDFFANLCRLATPAKCYDLTSSFGFVSAFFDIVRFHDAKLPIDVKKHVNNIRQLLHKHSKLRSTSGKDASTAYVCDIVRAYYALIQDLLDLRDKQQMQKQNQQMQEAKDGEQSYDNGNGYHDDDFDNEEDEEENEDEEESDDVEEKEVSHNDNSKVSDINDDETTSDEKEFDDGSEIDEDNIGKTHHVELENDVSVNKPNASDDKRDKKMYAEDVVLIDNVRKEFENVIFKQKDEAVYSLLTTKFFIKNMHSKQMGAIHKHSGKLDVKAVGRNDWKIFKQPSMFSDGSKIGKRLHLIIVLDQSGSYSHNDEATNKILSAIVDAEKKIKSFEFTMVKFGSGFHVCDKDDRYSESNEGTEFSIELFRTIESVKKPGYANFIIFLNDGAAWCSSYYSVDGVKTLMQKVLDHNNCVCILDYDAYQAWFKKFKTAKVIVTSDYVNQLSMNVCNALSAMLAV